MVGLGKATLLVCSALDGLSEGFRKKQHPSPSLLRVVQGGSMARGGLENPAMDHFRTVRRGGVRFLTAASRNPIAASKSTKEWLASFGVEAEWIPVFEENCADRMHDPSFVQMVEDAGAIFIGGGQSGRISSCLFGNHSQSGLDGGSETPFLRALQAKAVVGGSSAGAMTQPGSEILVTAHSVESYDAVRSGYVFQRDSGNNLLGKAQVVDTHFSERGRQGRLLVFATQTKQRWAFGVDEATAYVWRSSGEYEVTGAYGVVVFQDAEGMEESQSAMMHYLTAGDRINVLTGRIVFSSDKIPCALAAAPAGSNSIFNGDRTNVYKNISIAVAKAAEGARVTNYHGQPAVEVIFTNVVSSVAMCGPSGESFENLLVEQSRSASTQFINTAAPNMPLHYIYPEDED